MQAITVKYIFFQYPDSLTRSKQDIYNSNSDLNNNFVYSISSNIKGLVFCNCGKVMKQKRKKVKVMNS